MCARVRFDYGTGERCSSAQREMNISQKQQSNLRFIESRFSEIQRQYDGQESVTKEADDACGEEDGDVHVCIIW